MFGFREGEKGLFELSPFKENIDKFEIWYYSEPLDSGKINDCQGLEDARDQIESACEINFGYLVAISDTDNTGEGAGGGTCPNKYSSSVQSIGQVTPPGDMFLSDMMVSNEKKWMNFTGRERTSWWSGLAFSHEFGHA